MLVFVCVKGIHMLLLQVSFEAVLQIQKVFESPGRQGQDYLRDDCMGWRLAKVDILFTPGI